MQLVQPKPPRTLQIYREIEGEIARDCIEPGFPHSYLALESLTGPKEVWFLNGWVSADEQKQVADEYAKNTPLDKALDRNVKRKASLIFEHMEVFANYHLHLGRGALWSMGRGRFLVITTTKRNGQVDGTGFETGGRNKVYPEAGQDTQGSRCNSGGRWFRNQSLRCSPLLE